MSKHTPGPWDVRKIDSAVSFRGVFAICSNGGGGSIAEEQKANARLIAAAPELLSIVKKLAYNEGMEREEEFRKAMWPAMMAVIAKVEGSIK